MRSLDERGISGDPEISMEELLKREQEKKKRRDRREQKRGPNGEVLERSYDPRDGDLRFVFA